MFSCLRLRYRAYSELCSRVRVVVVVSVEVAQPEIRIVARARRAKAINLFFITFNSYLHGKSDGSDLSSYLRFRSSFPKPARRGGLHLGTHLSWQLHCLSYRHASQQRCYA
jgi:hypothetical protein